MGIGKTKTLNLGLIMANAPPRAKIAPDAPTATDKGSPRRGSISSNLRLPSKIRHTMHRDKLDMAVPIPSLAPLLGSGLPVSNHANNDEARPCVCADNRACP